MTILQSTKDIHTLTLENGGATYNLGYGNQAGQDLWVVSVSPQRSRTIPLDDFTPEKLQDWIYENRDVLIHPYLSIGTWVHDGLVYLDISETFQTRAIAQVVGEHYQQTCIYHLGTGEEFYLTPVPAVEEVS